jgi:hypothetical protein
MYCLFLYNALANGDDSVLSKKFTTFATEIFQKMDDTIEDGIFKRMKQNTRFLKGSGLVRDSRFLTVEKDQRMVQTLQLLTQMEGQILNKYCST